MQPMPATRNVSPSQLRGARDVGLSSVGIREENQWSPRHGIDFLASPKGLLEELNVQNTDPFLT